MYGVINNIILFNYNQIQQIARKVEESNADMVILGGDINSDPTRYQRNKKSYS